MRSRLGPLSRANALLVLLICLGSGLRLANLGNVSSPTDDEVTYARQANVWLESGRGGIRSLIEEYRRDPMQRHYPPPTRAGMVRVVAATMEATGRRDERVGSILSCAASIASLFVIALMGVRFLPPRAALAGLFFYSVFPAELAMARRTWTDTLVELAALLLVWFALEIARNSRRRTWYVLFAAVGGLGITVKESMLIPLAVCAAWILWVLVKKRGEFVNAVFLTATSAFGCFVSVWWLASMVGGFSDLISIVAGISKVNAVNPYVIEFASGPGYLLLDGFWIVSPTTALFFLVGIYATLRRPPELAEQHTTVRWIALFTLSTIAVAMIVPHWLNLRYVSFAFGTYCMLAGIGVWYPLAALWPKVRVVPRPVFAALTAVILISGAVNDYRYFYRVFVVNGTGDLSIKKIREQRRL